MKFVSRFFIIGLYRFCHTVAAWPQAQDGFTKFGDRPTQPFPLSNITQVYELIKVTSRL